MNIRKEIKKKISKGDIFQTWRITRRKETIFSFSFYSVKWQIENDWFLQRMKYKHLLRLNRGRTDKHLLRLNRGRTDKTSTSSQPGPHGQTITSCEPGPHGKLQSQRLKQKDEIIEYLTLRKIPRGRSETKHQLKNFNINKSSRTIEDLNSTKENYINKF